MNYISIVIILVILIVLGLSLFYMLGYLGGVPSKWKKIKEGKADCYDEKDVKKHHDIYNILVGAKDKDLQCSKEEIETAEADFTVKLNTMHTSYIINDDESIKNINGTVGEELVFRIDSIGHPFWIKSIAETGKEYGVEGIENNGTSNGTIKWIPNNIGTYYYICEYHKTMTGEIIITET